MFDQFFFKEERLFGCYYPGGGHDINRLLVICPPFFDEYRRSFRALADLATACAEHGVHVLRFDFFGIGESHGMLEQATIEDWKGDIEAAINEGIALSGVSETILLAVRFSATIASNITHKSIKRYIFWDPVDSGAEYLKWLDYVNQELRRNHQCAARDKNLPFQEIEFVNFKLTPEIKEEMVRISFNSRTSAPDTEKYVISTDPSNGKKIKYGNWEYGGLNYDWPAYHDGVITHKTVLERIAQRVLEL